MPVEKGAVSARRIIYGDIPLRRIHSIALLLLTLPSLACAQNAPQTPTPITEPQPTAPVTALVADAVVVAPDVAPTTSATTSPSGIPGTLPATNPADDAAVRDALSKYNAAIDTGDVDTAAAGIHTSSPAHVSLVALLKRGTAAGRGVYDATVKQFSADEFEKAGVVKAQFASLFTPIPVESLNIKIDGDKAALSIGDAENAMPGPTMVKVDGVWKLDATGLFPPVTEQQVKDQSAIFDAIIIAFDKTRDDVAAGKISSADEVVLLMNHRAERSAREAQMKQIPADLLTPPATEPTTEPAGSPAP